MIRKDSAVKIIEIIEALKRWHSPIDESRTGDVVKFGDPEQECTGIVTTVCATVDVVRRAVEMGANLIIVHEPLFYSDADKVDWLWGNGVYREKAALLQAAGIVVWRDHDHLHGGSPSRQREYPDLVFEGIMKELGWEDYVTGFPLKPLMYEIPETTAERLTAELVGKFHLRGARLVGNRQAKIKRVLFVEHVRGSGWGGREPDNEIITEVEKENCDALIPFEIVDWTLSAYVRDAAQLGRDKVLIEMGHFNVEELAMRHMARWLPEIIGADVPISFVQAGDFYDYYIEEERS